MPRGARSPRIVGVPARARASEVREYLGLPSSELGRRAAAIVGWPRADGGESGRDLRAEGNEFLRYFIFICLVLLVRFFYLSG